MSPRNELLSEIRRGKAQIATALQNGFTTEATLMLQGDFATARTLHAELELAITELGPIAPAFIPLLAPPHYDQIEPSKTEARPAIATFLETEAFWQPSEKGKQLITISSLMCLIVQKGSEDRELPLDITDKAVKRRLASLLQICLRKLEESDRSDRSEEGVLRIIAQLETQLKNSQTYRLRTSDLPPAEITNASPKRKKRGVYSPRTN